MDEDGHDKALRLITEHLARELNLSAGYHNHKESMAHAGLVVELALLAALVAGKPTVDTLGYFAIAAVWLIIHLFLRWQLRLRRLGDLERSSLSNVLGRWALHPPESDDLMIAQALPAPATFDKLLDSIIPWWKGTPAAGVTIKAYPQAVADQLEDYARLRGASYGEWMVSLASVTILVIALVVLY